MPGSVTQLRLIPCARPLDTRLGADYFRQLPRQPGVYRMHGEGGRLLYVGKAADLRRRLSSYRSLGQASPKTLRLLGGDSLVGPAELDDLLVRWSRADSHGGSGALL